MPEQVVDVARGVIEAPNLCARVLGVAFRRGEVGKRSLNLQAVHGAQLHDERARVLWKHAQPPHSGVDLDVDAQRMSAGSSRRSRGARHVDIVERHAQIMCERVRDERNRRVAERQERRRNAGLAQGDRFRQRRSSAPFSATLEGCARGGNSAVAVGVRLHHRHHPGARRDEVMDEAHICAQRRKIDLYSCRMTAYHAKISSTNMPAFITGTTLPSARIPYTFMVGVPIMKSSCAFDSFRPIASRCSGDIVVAPAAHSV